MIYYFLVAAYFWVEAAWWRRLLCIVLLPIWAPVVCIVLLLSFFIWSVWSEIIAPGWQWLRHGDPDVEEFK